MSQIAGVEAVRFIRKIQHGGSQPVLIEASDGFLYVTKFVNSVQGPHLLFNEVIGAELYRQVGLPVPEWQPIHLSASFVNDHPRLWMNTCDGPLRPKTGWAFGSRYLTTMCANTFEILPRSYYSKVVNRRDFTKAWVLDQLCDATDGRQVAFVEDSGGRITAFFIDQGNLFRGPKGIYDVEDTTALYCDPRIYIDSNLVDADEIANEIMKIDIEKCLRLIGMMPKAWRPLCARGCFVPFVARILDRENLRILVRKLLSRLEDARKRDDPRSPYDIFREHGACLSS